MNQRKRHDVFSLNEIDASPQNTATFFDINLNTDSKDTDRYLKTDTMAKRQYEARIKELKEDIAEADNNNDLATRDKANGELEELLFRLKSDFPHKKPPRTFRDDRDKTKDRICKAIARAVKEIKKHDPEIADHFEKALEPIHSIKKCYKPVEKIDWKFKD